MIQASATGGRPHRRRGVRHGDQYRVGRGIAVGELGEHILPDPHAVFILADGISRNGLAAAQRRLIRVVALIQVNPVIELFVRRHQRGVELHSTVRADLPASRWTRRRESPVPGNRLPSRYRL